MIIPSLIYGTMAQLADSYNGGYWDFFKTSNGAFYMVPKAEDFYNITCRGNYFAGLLSAEAAGIVVCLYAYSQAATIYDCEKSLLAYENLLEYAWTHPEADLIARAID